MIHNTYWRLHIAGGVKFDFYISTSFDLAFFMYKSFISIQLREKKKVANKTLNGIVFIWKNPYYLHVLSIALLYIIQLYHWIDKSFKLDLLSTNCHQDDQNNIWIGDLIKRNELDVRKPTSTQMKCNCQNNSFSLLM